MSPIQASHREITLFLGNLNMGGAERVFVTLARQFIRHGYQVKLILAHKTGLLLEELDPSVNVINLEAHRSGQPKWLFGLRTLWRLARYFRKSPPEIVLTTLTGANLVAILARDLSCRRFSLVVREAATLENAKDFIGRLAMRWLYPRADHVVVLTDYMKQQILENIGIPEGKVSVIPNPVDWERITALANSSADREKIDAVRPYVLAVGRLAPQKDFSTLVRSIALLEKPVNLVILGEGPQRQELMALISDLGLSGKISLPGVNKNPYPWFLSARAFVLSSRWEGYPNVLIEALCFGLPAVVTRYDPSVTDLINTWSGSGVTQVPVGDAHALADALKTVLIKSDAPQIGLDISKEITNQVVDRYSNLFANLFSRANRECQSPEKNSLG